VQEAAKALDYRPNLAGRSLRNAGIARIGVLYSNPSAAYLNQLMIGVLEESSQAGAQIIVEKCGGIRSQRSAMKRLLDAGVDGIILPPPLCDSPTTLAELKEADIPIVAVATAMPQESVTSVRIDDYQAARAMSRYLLDLGHRRIGFIEGDPSHTPAVLRTKAFFDTMAEAGIEVPDNLVVQGMFTYRSGLEAARQLLEQDPRPTAIFSSNDDMAAAAVAVAHGMHLRIPEDLTITGFDDTPVATTIWPTLTTIHQPVTSMGRATVKMMTEEIRLRRNQRRSEAQHKVMKYKLVERESSAKPAAR
jgi:LacI family transcriptional regulator